MAEEARTPDAASGHDQTANGQELGVLEPGSTEEIVERGDWLGRLMFGWMVGLPENRSYEEWLTSRGLSLG